MSRDYIELNARDYPPRDYPPPTEWLQQRRYSTSSDPDVQFLIDQSTLRRTEPFPSFNYNDHASQARSSLMPPPMVESRRYSNTSGHSNTSGYSNTSEPDIQMVSGQSTPPNDHRHTSWSTASLLPPNDHRHGSWSTASLLPPPMSKPRWYSQMSMSEASLGSYATIVDQRASTGSINDQNRLGTIVRLHDRDDVEQWKGVKRYVYFLAPFLILLDVAVYLGYLGFRVYCNVDVQRTTGIKAGAAWVFFGVEFLITIPYLMNNAWAMFALKTRNRPRLRLMGHYDVPTVDIRITCCKEDDDVIMDTVRAACDQDYPMDRFRVIILDDGKSAELAELAHEAQKMWPNLLYMSREKKPGVPHHFKAGNLNYGLEQTALLPGGSGEFVGALDADMVRRMSGCHKWLANDN